MTDHDHSRQHGDPPRDRAGIGAAKDDAPKTSRRRFGRAGLAAPVIMTLSSRPVWATGRQCTVSALASFEANGSRPVDMNTCQACSPGYWHIDLACWPPGWYRTEFFGEKFGYDTSYYEGKIGEPVDNDQPSYEEIVRVLGLRLEDFFPTMPPPSPLFRACRAVLGSMLNAVHPNVPFALTSTFILSELDRVFPGVPPLDTTRPTAGQSALLTLADNLAVNWDEESTDCILPGNGNCP